MAIHERWRRVGKRAALPKGRMPSPEEIKERRKLTDRLQKLPDEQLTADERKERRANWTPYYMVDFRDLNAPKKDRIFEVGGTTRTQAKDLLTRRLGEVRARTYVNPKRVIREAKAAVIEAEKAKGPSFAEFAKTFLDDYASQRRSRYYEWTMPLIKAHFESRLMKEITPADLDAYRRKRLSEVKPSTVRKQLTVLGTMFKMARRWGVVAVSPADDLEKPSEAPHRMRFLTPEEWAKLETAAEPWLRPILTMALATGARLKEVVGIQWENVDRDERMIHLGADNKTATARRIPIGATSKSILDDNGGRFKRAGYVFTDPEGRPYATDRQRNRITQRTKAAAVTAGLDDVSFHTLRHTAGSWLGQGTDERQGFTETEIGWLLGHSSGSMTARYVHPHDDRLRAMVSALDRKLGREGDPDGYQADSSEDGATRDDAKSLSVSV